MSYCKSLLNDLGIPTDTNVYDVTIQERCSDGKHLAEKSCVDEPCKDKSNQAQEKHHVSEVRNNESCFTCQAEERAGNRVRTGGKTVLGVFGLFCLFGSFSLSAP